jgi:hypothetical protein
MIGLWVSEAPSDDGGSIGGHWIYDLERILKKNN